MSPYAHITGWGTAIPERVLTNAELAKMVDTSDEWIVSRTGIRERRIASEGYAAAGSSRGDMRQSIPAWR